MKVLIFGATGMVGQGVVRESLLDPQIELVQTVGRSPGAVKHPKLREMVRSDLFRYDDAEADLRGFDDCFFCLGVTAAGRSESEYHRMTYDLTMAAAETLARLNPQMTFIYVSGRGTDSSEQGNMMWARVKGKTENAILRLPFRAAYLFRPGVIQPMHGEQSRTRAYRVLYSLSRPLLPLLLRLFPRQMLTTEEVGRAMIQVAKHGAAKRILEPADIKQCAREAAGSA